MAKYLRKIGKKRWVGQGEDEGGPLTPSTLSPDPIGDLATSDGKLSLWVVEDDNSNLNRLLVALATGSNRPDHMHFMVFDSAVLDRAGIRATPAPGESADKIAAQKWHVDLLISSASKLVEFACGLWSTAEQIPVLKKDLAENLRRSLAAGYIRKQDLKPDWQKVADDKSVD